MKITGQNYSELVDIGPKDELVLASFPTTIIEFDPEGAIKVAHALIEAAEKIVKK